MPLAMEVGLVPGHIVLDGDPAPSKKRHSSPPLFGPCLSWPNGHPSQQLLSSCFLFTAGCTTSLSNARGNISKFRVKDEGLCTIVEFAIQNQRYLWYEEVYSQH